MTWVNEVAGEIDRLVVATYEGVGRVMAPVWPLPNAHPAVLQGVGSAMVDGPVPVDGLRATYPYLPESMFDALVQNNIEEGLIDVVDGRMTLTDLGRGLAEKTKASFGEIPNAMWAGRPVDEPAAIANTAAAHGASLEPLTAPSAFSVQVRLLDSSLFRAINALRYWRADAHQAAWSGAGLDVKQAHALNVLWDMHRGLERVGQGDPRPGRTGVAGLAELGYADGEQITELGIKAREAIEADTDARTEAIYALLDDATRASLLTGLRQLPSD